MVLADPRCSFVPDALDDLMNSCWDVGVMTVLMSCSSHIIYTSSFSRSLLSHCVTTISTHPTHPQPSLTLGSLQHAALIHPLGLTATLASTALCALLGDLGDVGADGLVGGLLGLLVALLGLGLGDSGLAGSGTDLGLGGTLGEDGSKVGADDAALLLGMAEWRNGWFGKSHAPEP